MSVLEIISSKGLLKAFLRCLNHGPSSTLGAAAMSLGSGGTEGQQGEADGVEVSGGIATAAPDAGTGASATKMKAMR